MKKILLSFFFFGIICFALAQDSVSFIEYKNFDFIPADNIVFFEDFSSSAYASFPEKFKSEDQKGEVMVLKDFEGKWFKPADGSSPYFILKEPLITDFSVQFDILLKQRGNTFCFNFDMICSAPNRAYSGDYPGINGLRQTFTFDSVFFMNWMDSTMINQLNRFHDKAFMTNLFTPVRISISYIKGILKLYGNQYFIGEVKFPFSGASIIDMFRFYQKNCGTDNYDIYISNISIAKDYTDILENLVKTGKYISHAIAFEGKTDVLNGASYPVLKLIAEFLKKDKEAKIKITNLNTDDQALSVKRAQAIKNFLVKVLKSDAVKIIAEGKANNELLKIKTSEGKANSLRVEFVKM
jgi:hypothetical protein